MSLFDGYVLYVMFYIMCANLNALFWVHVKFKEMVLCKLIWLNHVCVWFNVIFFFFFFFFGGFIYLFIYFVDPFAYPIFMDWFVALDLQNTLSIWNSFYLFSMGFEWYDVSFFFLI